MPFEVDDPGVVRDSFRPRQHVAKLRGPGALHLVQLERERFLVDAWRLGKALNVARDLAAHRQLEAPKVAVLDVVDEPGPLLIREEDVPSDPGAGTVQV